MLSKEEIHPSNEHSVAPQTPKMLVCDLKRKAKKRKEKKKEVQTNVLLDAETRWDVFKSTKVFFWGGAPFLRLSRTEST